MRPDQSGRVALRETHDGKLFSLDSEAKDKGDFGWLADFAFLSCFTYLHLTVTIFIISFQFVVLPSTRIGGEEFVGVPSRSLSSKREPEIVAL